MYLTGLIIIPNIFWEVDSPFFFVFLQHGCAHERLSDQELRLKDLIVEDIAVFIELEVKGAEDSAQTLSDHELAVVKLQQGVALLEILLRALENDGSEGIGLLVDGIELVMVSREGVE
jgi:hypothetical protein